MKDCLIILGMGGPDSTDNIPTFLYNLFSDREIINFHIGGFLQRFVAKKIASKRGAKLVPSYLKMGMKNGASPQNFYNNKMLEKLPKLYKKEFGKELDCYAGMCYFTPYIEDTLNEVIKKHYRNIYLFSTYPQYSMTTTGALLSRIERFKFYDKAKAERIIVINEWFRDKSYNKLLAGRIKESAKILNRKVDECHIFFSAHSVPMSYIEKGDRYREMIAEHVDILVKMMKLKSYEIAYQSKVGPVKWLSPESAVRLHELKLQRVDNIIVVPISFISDHIETLIELDDELIADYKDDGLNIVRTKSLNDDKEFFKSIIKILK